MDSNTALFADDIELADLYRYLDSSDCEMGYELLVSVQSIHSLSLTTIVKRYHPSTH